MFQAAFDRMLPLRSAEPHKHVGATAEGSVRPAADIAILAAIAGVVLLQLWLVFAKSVNWDEFFHFHHLYEFRTGTSTRVLQTAYLRPLGFLLDVPGSTIDRIVIGRLAMLGCELVAGWALYGIARKYAARPAALICVLAWLTAGSVLTHGFALRADPPATALLLGAAWFMLARPLGMREACAAGFCLGLAGLITVKAAFYAPFFLAIAWLQYRDSRAGVATLGLFAIAGIAAVASFAVLLFLHGLGLGEAPVSSGERSLASAGGTVFSDGLLPQGKFLLEQCLDAPFFTAGLIVASSAWLRQAKWRPQWPLLAGCLLPLATVLFYRNSYPYYFVFILAPGSLALLPVIELILARGLRTVIVAALVANACVVALAEPRDAMLEQRRLERGLAVMFPEPVAYVDFAGVIGDAPRVLPFLTSGWGLDGYRRAGRDLVVERMAHEPVPLVIANHAVIESAVTGERGPEALRVRDRAILHDNFIQHWGPVWVAGKRIEPSRTTGMMEIAVPGTYTLEGAAITIDGRSIQPGEFVTLGRGPHPLRSDPRAASTLRWGQNLPRPSFASPGTLFTEY